MNFLSSVVKSFDRLTQAELTKEEKNYYSAKYTVECIIYTVRKVLADFAVFDR